MLHLFDHLEDYNSHLDGYVPSQVVAMSSDSKHEATVESIPSDVEWEESFPQYHLTKEDIKKLNL